ncbi:MAG: hypothetical protein HBSAPP03_19470 [Phycisphaerae bacterium]|nr:MAG: hypothetical protein HBSAPP03_19470 [Phycisphaerae bacterium]
MQRAAVLALIAGGCVGVGSARAQLVATNDQTSGAAVWLIDLSGSQANRSLIAGTNAQNTGWGAAADDVNGILYWNNGSTLYKAAYDMNNPMVPITMTTSAGAPTGLAFDSALGALYGRTSAGFVQYNLTTGAPTTVYAITAQDFGGFEYDAGTDAFYGLNDSTSTTALPGGRGLYRIDKPITSPTFTELADYPGGDTDIDGLGAGNGKLYLVNDNSTANQGIYVWNLAAGQFETSLPNPFTATTGIFSGGAWAPGLLIPPTGADLTITNVSNPSTLVIPPGGNVTYVVTVRNNGPEAATGVVMTDTLPAGMTFISVDGGASESGGIVTANIGGMASGETRVFNVVVTTNTIGSYQNSASVTGTSTDNNPNNNAANANTTVRAPMADLAVNITDPADCAVGQGGTLAYQVAVTNNGTESAESPVLVVTLPEGVTFQNSTPPVIPVGSTLTFNLATLGNGGTDTVAINATADQTGVLTITASVSSATSDPVSGNNSDTETTNVIGSPPATADAKGVFSNIATSDSSIVPGSGGSERFDTGLNPPGRPFSSPDGTKFIQAWSTDAATTMDSVLIVVDNGAGAVAAREGVTELPTQQGSHTVGPPYYPFTSFDVVYGINDAGEYVFSGIDSRSTTTNDGYVIKGNSGGTLTLIAQENVVEAPAQTGGTFYGATRGSVAIAQNGSVGMLHQIAGVATANDEFTLTNNGNTTVTQEQFTTVVGLGGGGTFTVNDVANGSAQLGYFLSADHAHHCYQTSLFGQPTTSDAAVVVDGEVRIQEGFAVPGSGFANTVTTIAGNRMEHNGDWFVRGSNITDGHDWVVRNGTVVAETGAPIFTGSSETYGHSSFAATFFMMLGNNNGDYVVGGVTSAADVNANAVLVLNGTTVLLRENDPIDLDNNGQFDDGYYLRTFIDDRAFMTNTDLYVVVRLRDAASAQCGAADTDRGQALIRIALPPSGPACDPDVNCDGSANGVDVEVQELAVGGDFTDYCQVGIPGVDDGDFNRDGAVNGTDVEAVENAVGGVCP